MISSNVYFDELMVHWLKVVVKLYCRNNIGISLKKGMNCSTSRVAIVIDMNK